MIVAYGRVEKVEKDCVMVRIERQEMCAGCHACEGFYGKKSCLLKCKDSLKCKEGDLVEVTGIQNHFLKASYILYGLPLSGFLGGIYIAFKFSQNLTQGLKDLACFFGALIGMGVMFGIIKAYERTNRYQKYLPKVVSKHTV